jgi:flagellar export protein FliJ
MMKKSKLQVVLSLRQLEEEVSKVRLAQSLEKLEASRKAVESTEAELEGHRRNWREAVEAPETAEQLRLFPAGRDRMKTTLNRKEQIMAGQAGEVDERRHDYVARHQSRRLLESLVARRVRRKALLQEVQDQNERDEQVLLGYGSS